MGAYAALPPFAAWRFVDAVDGFEVVYPSAGRLRGHTTAVEDGQPYAVAYDIAMDDGWRTREVHVSSESVGGRRSTVLLSDGDGHWTVDGMAAPHLDGLVDVDLEASACTNTLPVHRLPLRDGQLTAAPAVYVRALDASVTRLDQTYLRRGPRTFDYSSEGGAFRAVLEYDEAGLVVDYPGIARRFA